MLLLLLQKFLLLDEHLSSVTSQSVPKKEETLPQMETGMLCKCVTHLSSSIQSVYCVCAHLSVCLSVCSVALERETTLSVVPNDESVSSIEKQPPASDDSDDGRVVSVKGLNASWSMEPDKLVLSDISFSVSKVCSCATSLNYGGL